MATSKEEMIGVLTAMSIVSKRLARQLKESEEGEEDGRKRVCRNGKDPKKDCR